MLPAWATVAISLGGAIVVALSNALVTQLRIRFERDQQHGRLKHERETEWRERLVFAAADFATGVEQAILGLRNVMAASATNKPEVEPLADEAKRLVQEAMARMARIKLLFGEDAQATKLASALVEELAFALQSVRHGDLGSAKSKLEKAREQYRAFNAAALEMLLNPRWAVGANLQVQYDIAGAES
jgi:hypothetical protein